MEQIHGLKQSSVVFVGALGFHGTAATRSLPSPSEAKLQSLLHTRLGADGFTERFFFFAQNMNICPEKLLGSAQSSWSILGHRKTFRGLFFKLV